MNIDEITARANAGNDWAVSYLAHRADYLRNGKQSSLELMLRAYQYLWRA